MPVYKGGDSINGQIPSFQFHNPEIWTPDDKYGTNIVPIGNFSGRNYPSILITDPLGDYGGESNGAVFVFNVGASLSDTCRATAVGPVGLYDEFGIQAICAGDLLGNGMTEIMIGLYNQSPGESRWRRWFWLTCFLADTAYGYYIPDISVKEPAMPQIFSLSQNFPNPFSSSSQIEYQVLEPNLFGKQLN